MKKTQKQYNIMLYHRSFYEHLLSKFTYIFQFVDIPVAIIYLYLPEQFQPFEWGGIVLNSHEYYW